MRILLLMLFIVSAFAGPFAKAAAQGVAAGGADESPFCHPALANALDDGIPDDTGLYYGAAMRFAVPDCGVYAPEKAASMLQWMGRKLGRVGIAKALYDLKQRQRDQDALTGVPSDPVLFHVIALVGRKHDNLDAARADLIERFKPDAVPAELFKALREEMARKREQSIRLLLKNRWAEPYLEGAAWNLCFFDYDGTTLSPKTKRDCAFLRYDRGDDNPFTWYRETSLSAADINLQAAARGGDVLALLRGAERILEVDAPNALKHAYEWLLRARRAGAEVQPLFDLVEGRLTPFERTSARMNLDEDFVLPRIPPSDEP